LPLATAHVCCPPAATSVAISGLAMVSVVFVEARGDWKNCLGELFDSICVCGTCTDAVESSRVDAVVRGANNGTNIMFTSNTMVNRRFKQVLQIKYYVISIVRKWSLWVYYRFGNSFSINHEKTMSICSRPCWMMMFDTKVLLSELSSLHQKNSTPAMKPTSHSTIHQTYQKSTHNRAFRSWFLLL
jgi:hypothetical protein